MSVPERVRSYSKNLTLVALHKSEGTPFNSDADHPVQWRGVVSNTDSKCPYPKQELCKLLGEGAIEQVSASRRDGCFVQPLFGVPKREGGLCPILDLGPINRALGKRPFGMLTLKQILAQIRPGDWFASMDLKDVYFHIQIAPHHRRFSKVCCQLSRKSTAFQYSVLPSRRGHFLIHMITAPHQRLPCVEDSALSLIQGDRAPSRCMKYTSTEKRAKAMGSDAPARKAHEGEESHDTPTREADGFKGRVLSHSDSTASQTVF